MAGKTIITIKLSRTLTPTEVADLMETYNRWAPSRGLPEMESISLVNSVKEDLTILGGNSYEEGKAKVRELVDKLHKKSKL